MPVQHSSPHSRHADGDDSMAIETYNDDLPGMLRLTPEIRNRIYQHAGLGLRHFFDEAVPGVYDLGERFGFEGVKKQFGSGDKFRSFHGLLLSCQTIYAEAAALLYSTNCFIIRYHTRSSLEGLRNLTPRTLASLTKLKIVLNQASCHEWKIGWERSGNCCHRHRASGCTLPDHDHNLELKGSDLPEEAIITNWHATATYLASNITPGKLDLALVCDIYDHDKGVEMAGRVLDSLRLLPQLKDCHIRLCKTRDSRLQQLAHEAALHARGIEPSQPSASQGSLTHALVNIPRELRLRILEYTDLVTPWKEVTWSREFCGYYIERGPCSILEETNHCTPESHHGCQFNKCWATPWPQPSIGCFCRRRHTAFSSRCKCWAPPTPLFLVCRTLYSDANLVFYSNNRFIVIDSPFVSPFTPWFPGDYPHESFAASQFMRHIVPRHCLEHIRFLETVFSPFTHLSRPRDGHPALQDWSETLDWLKDKLNLPALTLRLVVAALSDTVPEGSRDMTQAQGEEVLTTYNRILAPIQHWGRSRDGGLARFFATLAWPFQWTRWVEAKLDEDFAAWDWLGSKDEELKKRAEQLVMGERYERVCLPGREPLGSVWTWSHDC